MKQFDDKFSGKVKEAFDNYNADHLAEEGWNSYLRKHAKKSSRAIVFPLWAKVASVAAILSIAVLLSNRINDNKAEEHSNQLAQESRRESTESAINKENTAATGPVIANPDQAAEEAISKAGQSRPSFGEISDSQVRRDAGSLFAETTLVDRSSVSENTRAERSSVFENTIAEQLSVTETIIAERSSTPETVIAAGLLFAESVRVAESLSDQNVKASDMSAWMKLPDNPIELRLIKDADTRLKQKPQQVLADYIDIPREKNTTTIMTGVSGMMASIDNASSTSQGVSFGLYVEQQLTRRISVRPGLAMAKHNYGMESTTGGNIALDYATPELNGLSGTTTSYNADIEVVSMEVPVNFVFSLWKRSGSNFFVTTGASTVFYLNQQMSGNFNNTYTRSTVDTNTGEVSYDSMTTTVKVESEEEALNRVDLLGLANFSAGYSIPFGKSSHLMFEPFVQLPLKDLTSLNMRIRYGGFSMKIQF